VWLKHLSIFAEIRRIRLAKPFQRLIFKIHNVAFCYIFFNKIAVWLLKYTMLHLLIERILKVTMLQYHTPLQRYNRKFNFNQNAYLKI